MFDFGVESNHNEEPGLIEECRSCIIPMREYAKIHKLDTKQRTVFQVICCSFMLDCIEKISMPNGLGINNLSGKKSRKKKSTTVIHSGHPHRSSQKPKALSKRSEPRGWRRWSRNALFNKKILGNFRFVEVFRKVFQFFRGFCR